MTNTFLLVVLLLLVVANLAALVVFGRRSAAEKANPRLDELGRLLERLERETRDAIGQMRQEALAEARAGREELAARVRDQGSATGEQLQKSATAQEERLDSIVQTVASLGQGQQTSADRLREELLAATERTRVAVDERLRELQAGNEAKLEQMRATVDEKLQSTLERRLGESFQLVSTRLEEVHKGLGEMASLASGVGDLKRVLSNVKNRGTWGEYQLGALLEEGLAPGQYATNVATRPGSTERVEFAVKLPGRDGVEPCWLPIDSKLPLDDYQRLVEAQERGDAAAVASASAALESRVLAQAKEIRAKYVEPPATTDFGILFLPLESLYAEVLRRPGLFERLSREQKITVTGPTTLSALLGSLQMGFRTLAIEKRSSEIREVLGAVRTEFEKFGSALEKVKKKLDDASNSVEQIGTRSRAVGRRLRGIDALPEEDASRVLALGPADEPDPDEPPED
jgi:DNA recombination protein RmuC